jgi:hypothetical protein
MANPSRSQIALDIAAQLDMLETPVAVTQEYRQS